MLSSECSQLFLWFSISSNLFVRFFGTVPSAWTIMGKTVTFVFNEFISFSLSFYYSPCEFFRPTLADVLSLESEWQQVSSGSRILLCILATLNNAISNSFSSLSKSLGTVLSMPNCTYQFYPKCLTAITEDWVTANLLKSPESFRG